MINKKRKSPCIPLCQRGNKELEFAKGGIKIGFVNIGIKVGFVKGGIKRGFINVGIKKWICQRGGKGLPPLKGVSHYIPILEKRYSIVPPLEKGGRGDLIL